MDAGLEGFKEFACLCDYILQLERVCKNFAVTACRCDSSLERIFGRLCRIFLLVKFSLVDSLREILDRKSRKERRRSWSVFIDQVRT